MIAAGGIPFGILLALVFGTFVSEDLTCASAGALIASGRVPAPQALIACFLGIWLGDLGLFALGRITAGAVLGREAAGTAPAGGGGRLARIVPGLLNAARERAAELLSRNLGAAILASRFLPGTRLPLYVAAGALGTSAVAFAAWTAIACLFWTPLVVFAAAGGGGAGAHLIGDSWLAFGLTLALAFVALRLLLPIVRAVPLLFTRRGRGRLELKALALWAAISKVWRWEFWPSWLFYLPIVPWILWLALKHRSILVITAVNPGIPESGIVGESKRQILAHLPAEWTLASLLLPAGDDAADDTADEAAVDEAVDKAPNIEEVRSSASRSRELLALLDDPASGWTLPIVMKPDAGQRGDGVKLIRTRAGIAHYLASYARPVLAQVYHPGPFEAGIFYTRMPGNPSGTIFSITDKQFSKVEGDGRSTFEELIWRHPRYRMQAKTFLARHAKDRDRVLARGERMRLAMAGNHAQGTMFKDGAHLVTPELEARIDAIAREFDGFFFGRFDVRYSDVEAFKAGRDLAIVELNGVTSESTNIYDPDRSLFAAYRTLARQWEIAFRIGEANRRRGNRASSARSIAAAMVLFYRAAPACALAD